VWTRDSSPFPLATPKPAPLTPPPSSSAPTPRPVRTLPTPRPQRSKAPTIALPGVAAPALPASSRPLPRPAPRVPPVPPPFVPAARAPAPPPPPPFPAAAAEGKAPFDDIEDPTPAFVRPGSRAAAPARGTLPPPPPRGFDIEDVLTPAPNANSGHAPRRAGFGGGPPPGQSVFAAPPPAASPYAYAAPAIDSPLVPPLVLNQPQTIDFRGAVTAMLPEKKGGPSTWFSAVCLLVALTGGAALAHKFVSPQAAALAAGPVVAPRSASAPVPAGVQPSSGDDDEAKAPERPAPRPDSDLDAKVGSLDADTPAPTAVGAQRTAPAASKAGGKSAPAKAKRGGGKRASAKAAQKRRGRH
jgi:hypothetical protein